LNSQDKLRVNRMTSASTSLTTQTLLIKISGSKTRMQMTIIYKQEFHKIITHTKVDIHHSHWVLTNNKVINLMINKCSNRCSSKYSSSNCNNNNKCSNSKCNNRCSNNNKCNSNMEEEVFQTKSSSSMEVVVKVVM
jgi:hypothetical protein